MALFFFFSTVVFRYLLLTTFTLGKIKICSFQKVGKTQNKVKVAGEIGCKNDIVLSKIVEEMN